MHNYLLFPRQCWELRSLCHFLQIRSKYRTMGRYCLCLAIWIDKLNLPIGQLSNLFVIDVSVSNNRITTVMEDSIFNSICLDIVSIVFIRPTINRQCLSIYLSIYLSIKLSMHLSLFMYVFKNETIQIEKFVYRDISIYLNTLMPISITFILFIHT